MAVPKRKTSKGKRDRRRSQHKIKVIQRVKCENCGALKFPHTICAKCGSYK